MKLGQELSEIDEPTKFVESNALLALQGDEVAHALALVQSMLPGERSELARACLRLADMCDRENGKPVTINQRYAVLDFQHGAMDRAYAKWGRRPTHVRRDGDCEGYCAACNLRDFAELLGIEVTG